MQGRIQGFGSAAPGDAASNGGGGAASGGLGSSSSSRYQGFGNPQAPPTPQQSAAAAASATLDMAKSWLSSASQAVGMATKTAPSRASSMAEVLHGVRVGFHCCRG